MLHHAVDCLLAIRTENAKALSEAGRDVPEAIALFALQKLAEDARMSAYTVQRAARFFMAAATKMGSDVWELRYVHTSHTLILFFSSFKLWFSILSEMIETIGSCGKYGHRLQIRI